MNTLYEDFLDTYGDLSLEELYRIETLLKSGQILSMPKNKYSMMGSSVDFLLLSKLIEKKEKLKAIKDL